MKKIFILIPLFVFVLHVDAQVETKALELDSKSVFIDYPPPSVSNINEKIPKFRPPTTFNLWDGRPHISAINGDVLLKRFILNVDSILSVKVHKDTLVMANDKEYNILIDFKYKKEPFQFIPLSKIRQDIPEIKENDISIFVIDTIFIKSDYHNYFIDNTYIKSLDKIEYNSNCQKTWILKINTKGAKPVHFNESDYE